MAVRDMGTRRIGHWGATTRIEWGPEEMKADKAGKWNTWKPEERCMKGCVTRQWEWKVITISQLEQDSHVEQEATKMEGEVTKFRDYQPTAGRHLSFPH